MTQSYSVNEFVGHFKPAIEQSDWKSSQALNPCFSRCESPPVLPPPDFFPSSTSGSTRTATAATSSTATPTPPSTSWASASRPCFSAKTRSLFRQRIIKMRKENSTGPPSALPFTTSPAAGGGEDDVAQQHQRPNKLPLPSVNVADKSIADRERKLPCPKGSLSTHPYQWQSKRHKITSPNGCAAKMPLIYDAAYQDLMDLADLSGATSLPTDDFDTNSISSNSKRGQIMLTPDEPGGFETGNGNRNSDNEIHLPHSESIPQQFWTVACGWIPIVGRDIVACLFSRDWQVREASVRRLSREIPNMLMVGHTSGFKTGNGIGSNSGSIQDIMLVDKLERKWKCAVEMIAKAAEDKVYKVYSVSIKALRTLLTFTKFTNDDVSYVMAGIRPILHSILLKCADGQKRMAELSLETIAELCLEQTFQLEGHCGQKPRSLNNERKSLELIVFQILLEDKDSSWQYTMGKLLALDHLLSKATASPEEKDLGIAEQYPQTKSSQKSLGRDPLFIALDLSFQNLSNSHSRVAKMALKVFVASANLLTALDSSAFEDVWKLVLTLGPTLQLTLKKKFKIALKSLPPMAFDVARKVIDGIHDGRSPIGYNSSVTSPFSSTPPAAAGLMRSTSHSPSRSTPSKSLNKTAKRPAPYAKNKPVLTKRKETSSSSGYSSMVKLPTNAWTTPPPQPLPPIMMPNPPTNLEISPMYVEDPMPILMPNPPTNLGMSPMYVQDPMPAIMGLAHHQSWKPKEQKNGSLVALDEDIPSSSSYKETKDWTKSFMLGSGAFSTCFQARDVQTGTLMAVKQIQLNRVQDDAEKERLELLLQQEISLMSMFDHPNLIRFFGVVQEDPQLNIFVEWMPGGSVSKLLDKHGSFNDNVIMKYTYQILQGLDYLHHHGILHRDLKGANLFVDTTGHLLRIGDFGAAACLYTKMTCPGEFRGQLQGTLAFMAPEVLRGESYGRSCDIWSLGCCIIEMATAKQPWNAADISNYYCLMYKIACSQEPPVIPTHLSPGLQDLTARCLQLIPDSRPQARELVHHPVFAELFH